MCLDRGIGTKRDGKGTIVSFTMNMLSINAFILYLLFYVPCPEIFILIQIICFEFFIQLLSYFRKFKFLP